MRYDQVLEEVRRIRPAVIIEIGTWNGNRAMDMLSCMPDAMYYGFDLFEGADDETDRRELNVKAHYSARDVARRLRGFDHELISGDTRQTLPEFAGRGVKANFVWLDGGHSVETIASDWQHVSRCLAPGAVVMFDDWYDPEQPGFGCNTIAAAIPGALVLPSKDIFFGLDGKPAGRVHVVRVTP